MRPGSEVLGLLQPIGGGDPIPLMKKEIVIGRRPSCDISLDFENISGKHCALKFINGVWSVDVAANDARSASPLSTGSSTLCSDSGA